ncbi:hypothetical protein J4410_07565 [Candidatus Woesearchaeota archaeon]|nr:hypothetical protein [Candidatus Woesearchaeota archaeon]
MSASLYTLTKQRRGNTVQLTCSSVEGPVLSIETYLPEGGQITSAEIGLVERGQRIGIEYREGVFHPVTVWEKVPRDEGEGEIPVRQSQKDMSSSLLFVELVLRYALPDSEVDSDLDTVLEMFSH